MCFYQSIRRISPMNTEGIGYLYSLISLKQLRDRNWVRVLTFSWNVLAKCEHHRRTFEWSINPNWNVLTLGEPSCIGTGTILLIVLMYVDITLFKMFYLCRNLNNILCLKKLIWTENKEDYHLKPLREAFCGRKIDSLYHQIKIGNGNETKWLQTLMSI